MHPFTPIASQKSVVKLRYLSEGSVPFYVLRPHSLRFLYFPLPTLVFTPLDLQAAANTMISIIHGPIIRFHQENTMRLPPQPEPFDIKAAAVGSGSLLCWSWLLWFINCLSHDLKHALPAGPKEAGHFTPRQWWLFPTLVWSSKPFSQVQIDCILKQKASSHQQASKNKTGKWFVLPTSQTTFQAE